MYINITVDLVSIALGNGGLSQNANEVLEKLNDAVKYGFHYIRAKCDTVDLIQKAGKWPYLQALSRYLSIKPPFKWRVEFIPGEGKRDDIDKVCYISLKSSPSNFDFIFSKTKLLTENSTDGTIYRYLLDYYKEQKGIVTDNSFECISGGGNTIGEEFDKYCRAQNSFCLCISDSDMHYPDAPLGGTAMGVERVHKKLSPFGYGHILKTLEIENLLPQQLYEQYYNGHLVAERFKFDQINTIAQHNESYIQFIDLKLGICLYDLLTINKEDNTLDIVKSLLPDIENKLEEDKKIINNKDEQKECRYVQGYGNDILKKIEKKLENKDILFQRCDWKLLTSFQKKEYEAVGSILNDWTCCSERSFI